MFPSQHKITLITLGEELLLGLTENSHLTYIGSQFRKRGITLYRNITISDSSEDIEEQFAAAWADSDLVITTGGLGPTIDDRTKESIASALQEDLVFDESIARRITEQFEKKDRTVTKNILKQAYRLENSEEIPNDSGTAPGLYLNKDNKHLIMLPGPPSELRPMFENYVFPILEKHGLVCGKEHYLQIRTIGLGESFLENKLDVIFSKYENLLVAYCAHNGHVDIRLSFAEEHYEEESLLEIAEKCKSALGLDFLCFGHDSLEKVVSNLLRRNGGSLAVAEGCTGGMLSNAFTDIPGAAKFYLGGLTCYSNQSKIDLLHVPEDMIHQHSSISDEVAVAMASGVAEVFESDFALSTTGYSGPKGEQNVNSRGIIYIGLHTNEGIWSRKLELRGDRQAIKKRTTLEALDWLRRILLETPNDDLEHLALKNESNNILKMFSN